MISRSMLDDLPPSSLSALYTICSKILGHLPKASHPHQKLEALAKICNENKCIYIHTYRELKESTKMSV